MQSSCKSGLAPWCVVLDMDDTLYLERDFVKSAFLALNPWGERHGIETFFDKAWALFEAGTRGDIFDQLLKNTGKKPTKALIQELVSLYRTHAPNIGLLDDARALLDKVHGEMPMALITDGPKNVQQSKADALGLKAWFGMMVFTDDLGPGRAKPHPASFEKVQNVFQGNASRFVYVGDNPAKDFRAPKCMGWKTVRIRRKQSLHEHVPSGLDVDEEITSLGPLTEILGL